LIASSNGNNLPGNTALNSTTAGYQWDNDCINNNFTASVVANYLRLNVTDSGGLPIFGAQFAVVSNETIVVYATPYFGGSNSPTGTDGLTLWFVVPYRTFITNDSMTVNNITVTVLYSTLSFSLSPKTVNMSTSHQENFTAVSSQPSPLQTMLSALLSLAGMQAGASPMVYVATGLAVVAIVEAPVLFYFFRRVKA
jgi:hypothetical protein